MAAASTSSVAITYVPADCGSVIPGKSKAPEAFRRVEIVDKLRQAGVEHVSEHHALESPARYVVAEVSENGIRNEEANLEVCDRVFKTISQNLDDSSSSSSISSSPSSSGPPPFQLILGGECSMSPAIMSAFWQHYEKKAGSGEEKVKVGLIYIDADTDMSSPTHRDSTGIVAGMNMTHLMQGHGTSSAMKRFSRSSASDGGGGGGPVCDASNTVFFGVNMSLASNTREHFTYLFDHEYQVMSSSSVAKDPEQRARRALEYLESSGVDLILLHFDVDSIDARMFPLANVPNLTGVSFEQMMKALKVLLASDKVAALTVAEVNPDHDPGLGLIERLTGEIVAMLAARGKRSR